MSLHLAGTPNSLQSIELDNLRSDAGDQCVPIFFEEMRSESRMSDVETEFRIVTDDTEERIELIEDVEVRPAVELTVSHVHAFTERGSAESFPT